MSTSEKQPLADWKMITWVIIGALVIYLFTAVITGTRLRDIQQTVRTEIDAQHVSLVTFAKTATSNEADTETLEIIRDCSKSEREQFYELLGNLNNKLTATQLSELQVLFGRCGDYYAVRKSIMTARLEREIDVYKSLVDILNAVTRQDNAAAFQLAAWDELAVVEKSESDSYSELVTLQDKIITALLAGKAPDSAQVKEILEEVAQAQADLKDASVRSAEIRSGLLAS
jgi:hypothetical protein